MEEKIKELSDRLEKIKEKIKSEESTKQSLILPFIQTLGYDIFNPEEVTPEVFCGLGKDKGERIDYVIYVNSEPSILIECKQYGKNLNQCIPQLARYFASTPAKLSILTDGQKYMFFSDIEKTNLMDKTPFLTLDINDIKDSDLDFLKLIKKDSFNPIIFYKKACENFYHEDVKTVILGELMNPPSKWLKHLSSKIYPEPLSSSKLDEFKILAKSCIEEIIKPEYIKPEYSKDIKDNNLNIEREDYSQDELKIIEIVKRIISNLPSYEGKLDIKKLAGNEIRFCYENEWWQICRIKWGTKSKYLKLCEGAKGKDAPKFEIESIEEIKTRFKDSILRQAKDTEEICLNWRSKHSS